MVAQKTPEDDKGTVKPKQPVNEAQAADLDVQDGRDGRDNTKTLTRDAKQHEIIAEDERRSNELGNVHHALVEQAAIAGGTLVTAYDEEGNAVQVLPAIRTEDRYYFNNGYPTEPAKRPDQLAPAETDWRNLEKQLRAGFVRIEDIDLDDFEDEDVRKHLQDAADDVSKREAQVPAEVWKHSPADPVNSGRSGFATHISADPAPGLTTEEVEERRKALGNEADDAAPAAPHEGTEDVEKRQAQEKKDEKEDPKK